jgi:hypothetical protein
VKVIDPYFLFSRQPPRQLRWLMKPVCATVRCSGPHAHLFDVPAAHETLYRF